MAAVIVITPCGDDRRHHVGAAALIRPLRARGHRVIAAAGIAEVLSHLRHHCPDLLVLPVSMLGSEAIPLIESLCPARRSAAPMHPANHSASAGTTTVLYWDQVCPAPAGGPRAFGAGYFVARAPDLEATCDRVLACLPSGPPAADEMRREESLQLRFEPGDETRGEPVRVVA